jgi:hypothetical protein
MVHPKEELSKLDSFYRIVCRTFDLGARMGSQCGRALKHGIWTVVVEHIKFCSFIAKSKRYNRLSNCRVASTTAGT